MEGKCFNVEMQKFGESHFFTQKIRINRVGSDDS